MDSTDMNRDSQRDAKGRVFEMLDTAIRQAGVDTDADHLYATAKGSLLQGRRWPWFRVNEARIMAMEGGYENATLAVAGMALGMMEPGTKTEDMKQVILDAGEKYRSQLHNQWNIRGDDPIDRHPVSMAIGFPMDMSDDPDAILDFPDEKPEPRPEFNPASFKDPRLRKVWPQLTQQQREILTYYADTESMAQASEMVGVTHSGGASRISRARDAALALLESDK